MDIRIIPSTLTGAIDAILSKSDAHRKLICASLCENSSSLALTNVSQDIFATIVALNSLGAEITCNDSGAVVRPISSEKLLQEKAIYCGESGSTLRFLLPVVAAVGQNAIFSGLGRLPNRPMKDLCQLLREHGVMVSADFLPISISGKLNSGEYKIRGDISSQYISGLLFALPLLEGNSEILLTTALESAGYVDLTISALKQFGVVVESVESGWKINGNQKYCAKTDVDIEGDWSNAAFWICAGALGGCITINGLDKDSLQRDREILKLLQQFGARVVTAQGTISVESKELRKKDIEIDAKDIPDLVPILCVLACSAECKTIVSGCARLRIKESDRIKTVCSMICALGGEATEIQDSIVIVGKGYLRGGTVNSENDHRIAMAAGVASCICKEAVVIKNADAVNKSYPNFWVDFNKLGGKANVI